LRLDYRIKNTNEDEMNGKGDKRRPMDITHKEFTKKWNEVFGKKRNKKK